MGETELRHSGSTSSSALCSRVPKKKEGQLRWRRNSPQLRSVSLGAQVSLAAWLRIFWSEKLSPVVHRREKFSKRRTEPPSGFLDQAWLRFGQLWFAGLRLIGEKLTLWEITLCEESLWKVG